MKSKFKMLKELLESGISKEKIRTKNFKNERFKIKFFNWNLSLFDFSSANFRYANFSSADFSSADFSSANFSSADFRYADFSSADFRYANFRYANFSSADFRYADFSSADFRYANFSSADFSSANLNFKINESTFGLTLNCPESGSFNAFKKADGLIIKLFIPVSAKRSSATTYKCRCNKAKVVSIENIDGTKSELTKVCSSYDSSFIYEIGKTVKVSDFDDNRWNEYSTGIHFFMSRKMAECYN